ncbi:MAG: aminoacetone oxidase family FAD-binding enzyme [Acutalibacteraceae bacterium]|nr:aminoacetone oxidase family FAD-binding enzyme [Acutalibacteraceae bacterium]
MQIAVIGGGASGLTCAISAARKAKKNKYTCDITVFEAKDRVGKKILATGNGRCNMLNKDKSPFYFSDNKFHLFAVNKFNCDSNIEFFKSMGLYVKTDEEGRVYPLSNQATSVLETLRLECDRLGIKTVTDYLVDSIIKKDNGFIINNELYFDKVVLACGGMASVKNFNGYGLLSSLGHRITKVSPSLSKLNVSDTKYVKQLQGIRHKVRLTLTVDGRYITEESGELLFTKYGLSGIAVMQLSAFITRLNKNENAVVTADFIPAFSLSELIEALNDIIDHDRNMKSENLLSGFMPKKIGEAVIRSLNIDLRDKVGKLSEKNIKDIAKRTKKFSFSIESVRPFEDAQVTAGGADTKYFSDKTMESLLHKGLFAVGEILDVDGLCGGYNLMWAWSSGRLCGEALI